jgi:hypothetical protein
MSAKKSATRVVKKVAAKVAEPVEPKRAAKVPEVLVSAARVRTHIDRNGLNKNICAETAVQKALLDPKYVAAKTALSSGKVSEQVEVKAAEPEKIVDGVTVNAKPAEYETKSRDITDAERAAFEATVAAGAGVAKPVEQKLAALSSQRFRISQNTPLVLSIVAERMVSELMHHTMKYATENKRKIISVAHLHESDPSKLSLYPLYANVPSFREEATRVAKEAAEELAASTRKQTERDVKKQYGLSIRAKKTEAALAEEAKKAEEAKLVAAAEAEVDDESEADSGTSFRFYVGQVCKQLINANDSFKSVRVSKEIRSHVSDVITDVLVRFSTLLLQVTECLKNKTISESSVMHTLEILLTDGHERVETLELKPIMVPEPKALEVEEAKVKANKDYKFKPEDLPQVSSWAAVRTVSYPTSGYNALAAELKEKLEAHAKAAEKAPKQEVAEVADEL